MARPKSAPDPYLLSKVSTLYYLRDQTQQEIADRLSLSRPTISRLLQEARDIGIVQIKVAPPRGLHIELESLLEERYGLRTAQVVGADVAQPTTISVQQIGMAAASYLARTVLPRQTIGLAWGSTLNAMVHALSPLPLDDVRVVQTLGGIGPPDAEAYAADLVRRLAQQLGAAAVLLPAPGIVSSAAVRDALCQDRHVQAALSLLDALDIVFVGIGALATNPVLTDGQTLPRGTHAEFVAAGAVCDIALRFFSADGLPVSTSLDERILGIATEQLRKAGQVVAVAGGPEKVDAIHAALLADVIDVLITDFQTAEALIQRFPVPPRRK